MEGTHIFQPKFQMTIHNVLIRNNHTLYHDVYYTIYQSGTYVDVTCTNKRIRLELLTQSKRLESTEQTRKRCIYFTTNAINK